MELSVAIVQFDIIWENATGNREKLEKLIQKSDTTDLDLLVLPETFNTGFSMNNPDVCEHMNGETIQWMLNIASKNNFAICGSILIQENEYNYNRFLFVEPNGKISSYDKRHLFSLAKEDRVFTQGKENIIIEFNRKDIIWSISPFICYDLRFPVWSRNTKEVDVQIYVANFPEPRSYAWKQLLIARAIENQCFVIGANRIGTDGSGLPYSGHSCILDYSGKPLLTFESNEQLKRISINKNKLIAYKRAYPFYKDKDDFRILD